MSKKSTTVLIAGQLASGTTEAAQLVSEQTGLPVYNSESFFREIAAEFQESFQYLEQISRSGEVDLEKVMEGLILDKVREGNLIIEGRAALIAMSTEGALRVFLHKEVTDRQKFLASRRKIDEEEALKELGISDQERATLVRTILNKDWLDSSLYDLTVNTSKLTHQEAAKLIVEAMRSKAR